MILKTLPVLTLVIGSFLVLEALHLLLVWRARRRDHRAVLGLDDEYLPEHWRSDRVEEVRRRIIALERRVGR